MSLIKLDAIDSTNDFLKELSKSQALENYTTVIANQQTKGRGQMGATWCSEKDKNLIMSTLIKDLVLKVDQIFELNALISVSVIEALKPMDIPNLSIKWPNDIMSEDKKIAGILIENSFKTNSSITSIVGIGLNVNQTQFDELPNASSLCLQTGKQYSIEELLDAILIQIKYYSNYIVKNQSEEIWDIYNSNLYRKEIPTFFEGNDENRFTGIIKSVTTKGKLIVLLEDDSQKLFSMKEVKMIY